jgi:hypothetical protein
METPEILQVNLENYTLGVSYYRQNMAKGGVSIFVKKNLKFNQLNILHHCNEQDIECRVVHLESKHSNIYVLAIYRAPTGDFKLFLNKLESIIDIFINLRQNLSFVATLILIILLKATTNNV